MSAKLEQQIINLVPMLSAIQYRKSVKDWQSNMRLHRQLSDQMREKVEQGYKITNKRKCFLTPKNQEQ